MNIDALFDALLKTTWVGSAAVVLVLALRKPLRRLFGAGVAYAAWWLLPVALVAVVLPAPLVPASKMLPLAMRVAGIRALPVMQATTPFPWQALLTCTWLFGAAAALLVLLRQQRHFQRGLQIGETRDGVQFARNARGLPAVIGVWRPRIVLPADFEERYDGCERELILCHERVHIRRGDLQANAFAAALRCIYWFNPLLHVAVRRFRCDQELACDARVVAQHPQRRRAYADAMLKTQLAVSPLPLGCHWQARFPRADHPLKERITMLKSHASHPRRAFVGALIVSLLSVSFGYVAWAAQPVKTANPPEAHVDAASKDMHPPKYPADAVQKGIGGKVVVQVDVAADGSASKTSIVKSEPQGEFDAVTLDAAKKWKFVPAMKNGKPVAGRVRVPVCFTTDENAKDDCWAKS